MQSGSKRSHTAEGAAALRAAAARELDPAVRNPDYLAEHLIGPVYQLRVRVPALRRLSLRIVERLLPGLWRFITARTKHFDALLLDEVSAGAKQVVILGAGADSRAHRFADRLRDVDVFELDHPATSAWKRSRAARLPAARVRYVAVEFNSESVADALARAGVATGARTVFLWEGVTPYLTDDAVDATLAAVASFAPGSSLVFDYLYRDAIDEPARYAEADKYFSYMGKHGEPLVFGLDPDDLAARLAPLIVASNAGPDELLRLHLTGTGRILSFSAIAHARVPG